MPSVSTAVTVKPRARASERSVIVMDYSRAPSDSR